MIKIHVENKKGKQRIGKLIAITCCCKSNISVLLKREEINAKSIMKIPIIERTEKLDFTIDGEDEIEAAEKIQAYFNENEKQKG